MRRPMARKLRVQYPGAIYHVMNRGDHWETVFRDGGDPELFLATLAEACGKTDWQVHSFCLMAKPFHLIASFLNDRFDSWPSQSSSPPLARISTMRQDWVINGNGKWQMAEGTGAARLSGGAEDSLQQAGLAHH